MNRLLLWALPLMMAATTTWASSFAESSAGASSAGSSDASSSSSHHNKVVLGARDDAAQFLATAGHYRSARLQAAFFALRQQLHGHEPCDWALAQRIVSQ